MPTWVMSAIGVVVAICGIAAQFYFRWVPDIEVQKRHVKRAVSWASDILTLAAQVAALYFLVAHVKGPVTPGIVVEIAAYACVIVFCVLLTVIRRGVLALFERHLDTFCRLLDNTDQNLKNTSKHLAITEQHRDALRVIADDPNLSIETARALQRLLGGDGKPDTAALRLPSATAGKKTRKSLRGGL